MGWSVDYANPENGSTPVQHMTNCKYCNSAAIITEVHSSCYRHVYFVVKNVIASELVLNLAARGITNNGTHFCESRSKGLHCYSSGLIRSNAVSLSTIVGEYYLSGNLHLLKFPIPPPRPLLPSPYCAVDKKRFYARIIPDLHLKHNTTLTSPYVRGQARLGGVVFGGAQSMRVSNNL